MEQCRGPTYLHATISSVHSDYGEAIFCVNIFYSPDVASHGGDDTETILIRMATLLRR